MGSHLSSIVFCLVAASQFAAQPPVAGSHLAPEENQCAQCHGDRDRWDGDQLRLYVSAETFAEDAHFLKGVNCHDCHGGDPRSNQLVEAHQQTFDATETVVSASVANEARKSCARCHAEQAMELLKGVHAKAGDGDRRGRPMDCSACHGKRAHGMVSVRNARSPVFLHHQVDTCGECHPEDQATYRATVHAEGLYDSGLLVTAVCADCHGAHGVYYVADARSTLHPQNVAKTCSACHQYIEERLLQSVHGRGAGPGTATDEPAAGGRTKRKPSCIDCHEGHHLLRFSLATFRGELANHCGNCHAELSARYALSTHGKLTELGYEAAANCADCHGAHDILPIDDRRARTAAGENRLKTCRACHPYAVANFADFDPHANFKNEDRYGALHAVYLWTKFPFDLFFGVFVLHALLWYLRAVVHRLRFGGHQTLVPEQHAFVRFEPIQRVLYATLIISFLGLSLTGLPLKFGSQNWGKILAGSMGGFENTGFWHHFFAALALVACAAYVVSGLTRIARRKQQATWSTIFAGLDSPLPHVRDPRDLTGMLRWFFGLGRKPGFERWTYWEKLDFWAICVAVVLIGSSGLMLWYPNLFCRFLPGSTLNVAQVIHSEFAVYIACSLFLIHFFHTHFRPEKAPLDVSALTGIVSESHLRRYRPDYVRRLEADDRLSQMRRKAPSRRNVWLHFLVGSLIFALGLCLLAVVLLVSLGE